MKQNSFITVLRFAAILFGTTVCLTFIMCLTSGIISLMSGASFGFGFTGVIKIAIPVALAFFAGVFAACQDLDNH